MGEDTQRELTQDIEGTRQDLSRNLDALTDKVSPSRVVERRVERTRSGLRGLKDKVMGSAHDTGSSMSSGVSDTAHGVKDSATGAVHGVADSASSAKDTVRSQAEGNPLAAGLIAFGAGWLVSSLIPASQKEARAASAVVDKAKEHGGPVMDEAKQVGQEMGEQLKEKATDAAEQLKSSAQESAQNVKEEGKSSADSVKEDVKSEASGSSSTGGTSTTTGTYSGTSTGVTTGQTGTVDPATGRPYGQ